jgi:hypothetical protein
MMCPWKGLGIQYMADLNPPAPRFLILDFVRIAQHPSLVADGSAGKDGVVTGMRGYDDGSFRYKVSSIEDSNVDDMAGIYDEDMLTPTGKRSGLELFTLPAGFRVRDIATVLIACPDTDLAGRTVEITDGRVDEELGTPVLGVWCAELREAADLPIAFLRSTGERLPPSPLGESQAVSPGQRTGRSHCNLELRADRRPRPPSVTRAR